ncbi:MAG: hypothetical protein AAGE52_19790 [Myxococcota bacterium]
MPQLRSERLDVDSTSYYHLMSRCVRRAFLCGKDPYTGKDFDYRREWIEERLFWLCSVFAVDLHAYAVMSNHLHVVVRVDRERAEGWSDAEVVRRYGKLFRFKPKELETLPQHEREARVAAWRERLWSLSWLMRCLNEGIARRANDEDGCKGRFWEGRFVCQPLLDEAALLTCMAYVDLNPVRAGLAKSLRGSKHTSIRRRLRAHDSVPAGLAPFADQVPARSRRTPVPISSDDYVSLLEWAGRAVLSDSVRGRPAALGEFGLDPTAFLGVMALHGLQTASALGSADALEEFAGSKGRLWVRGVQIARQLVTG